MNLSDWPDDLSSCSGVRLWMFGRTRECPISPFGQLGEPSWNLEGTVVGPSVAEAGLVGGKSRSSMVASINFNNSSIKSSKSLPTSSHWFAELGPVSALLFSGEDRPVRCPFDRRRHWSIVKSAIVPADFYRSISSVFELSARQIIEIPTGIGTVSGPLSSSETASNSQMFLSSCSIV